MANLSMTNDEILASAIRLIKAGKKQAAQSILEPLLLKNPNHIQSWMWLAEIFPSDSDKIAVLEECLQKNPGNAQVIQALNFLKNRSSKIDSNSPFTNVKPSPSSSPFTVSSPVPFAEQPSKKPAPPIFDEAPAGNSSPFSTSPFSSSPFSSEFDSSPVFEQPAKPALPPLPQLESFEPEKTPTPKKKNKGKRSKIADIFIIVGACLLFALLAGGYIGGGFYYNGKINNFFVQKQCDEVVQYNTFISLYPQGIFSSFFTGHKQYAECRLKLDVDQFVKAKDWNAVVALARQYLAAYPTGSFVSSMEGEIAGALSAWAKELIEDKNYASGIQRFKDLVDTNPTGAAAEPAREEILQAYFTATSELLASKNYAEAEQNLKSALAYFSADSARTAKINQQMVDLYIAWGNSQVEIGNLDNAIKYYQQAGEISQGKMDVDLLIAKAYLKQAVEIADKNDFNRALTKVQEISDSAKSEKIKAEAAAVREKILTAYSNSSSQTAIEQIASAVSLTCSGQHPELPIFGLDKKNIRFGLVTLIPMQLPAELAATTPGQLHYVACTVEKETEIGKCPYDGGLTLYRLRYEWDVNLYDTATGTIFASQTIKGSSPAECKAVELFTKGMKYKKSYGNKPTLDQIVTWIKELNIIK